MTPAQHSVLVADDDPDIRDLVVFKLEQAGFNVRAVGDGNAALEVLKDTAPDLVVLDVMMPGLSGLDVLRQIRAEQRLDPVKVLLLTARARDTDVDDGYNTGADDYVTKPFRLAELLARVRALLRRTHGEPVDEDELHAQDVRVDVAAHRAFQSDRELHLTAKEFDLLRVLLREQGKVVSREQLMREVWATHWYGSTKTLDMHVSVLRRKLGDDVTSPRFITTVRGVGFRFERPTDQG